MEPQWLGRLMNAPALSSHADDVKGRTVLSLWRGELPARRASMHEIATAVAAAKGVTLESLRAHTRRRPVCWARQEALALIHAAGWSNAQAARFMGLKDHTTTVHARRAVAARAVAQRGTA